MVFHYMFCMYIFLFNHYIDGIHEVHVHTIPRYSYCFAQIQWPFVYVDFNSHVIYSAEFFSAAKNNSILDLSTAYNMCNFHLDEQKRIIRYNRGIKIFIERTIVEIKLDFLV